MGEWRRERSSGGARKRTKYTFTLSKNSDTASPLNGNRTLTQLHTKQCHGDAVNSDKASHVLNRHRTVIKTVINPSGRLTPQLWDRKSGELETKEPDDLETAVSEVNIGDARGGGSLEFLRQLREDLSKPPGERTLVAKPESSHDLKGAVDEERRLNGKAKFSDFVAQLPGAVRRAH